MANDVLPHKLPTLATVYTLSGGKDMRRPYADNEAERGEYAEAHKDGRRIAEFRWWSVVPEAVDGEVKPLAAFLATGEMVVGSDSGDTPCVLVLYESEVDCPAKPWRVFSGGLSRSIGADEDLEYSFEIAREHET